MFNRKANHLQAVRVDHYAPRRSRRLSFGTLAISVLVCSAILVWGIRSWHAGTTTTEQPVVDSEQVESSPLADTNEQALSTRASTLSTSAANARKLAKLNRTELREILTPYVDQGVYPAQINTDDSPSQALVLDYTLNPALQEWAQDRLAHYDPDYGVFVALDPDTGKLLALASSRRDQTSSINLATKATYPAASTIKLITAAAAIEEGKATPETVYALNGKSTSLYKKQVFDPKPNKWTRHFSLERAFAKSVNPIFARIGLQALGGETLLRYAEQFGFNAQFLTDFEFDNGTMELDISDEWQTAESASGYTRRNTLSPIHGAAIAASIINGGYLIAPTLVDSVTSQAQGDTLYQSGDPRKLKILSGDAVESLQQLMAATVKVGTGRKTFRRFFKRDYEDVIAGGKTGHLSGNNPKGSYDWFIGYGKKDEKKIAFAMLCINKEKWYVKSAQFAREALEHYFKGPLKSPSKTVASSQHETIS